MSAAGGPRIARDNMVMCLDAHDAKSYPGEPTTNYFGHLDEVTLGEFGQLGNLVPIFETYGLVPYTMSMDIKVNKNGGVYVYMQNGSYTKYSFVAISVSCTKEYQRFTFSNLTPAGPTAAWTANTPTDHRAMLAMYTGYGTDINPTVRNIQIEKGSYATPFVGRTGKNMNHIQARPTSVNLLIHGNVGSGQSFYDSSPNKHTVSVNGDVTHSNTKSKFSGGSIYFDGAGDDYLYVADSDDWHVGSGDFTVDMWINGDDYANVSYPALYSQFVDDNNFLCLYFAGASRILLWGRNAGSAYSTLDHTGTTWTAGVWYHVALVRNGTTTLLFRDGVLLDSVTESWTASNITGALYVGWWGYGTNYGFKGYMDQFRFTKGTALWGSAFTPPTRRNLKAPAVDLSGSDDGGNFTTKAMTDVTTYRDGQVIEPVASAVWDFDGTDDYISCGNGSSLNFGTGDFTIGFWVNITDWVGNWAWPISKAPGYSGMFIALTSPGYFRASLGAWFTDVIGSYSSEPAISFGTWYHFTLKRASGSVTAYLNGNQYGTSVANTYDLGTESANSFNIGLGPDATANTNGRFGAVQVYKTALTAQQVKQSFDSQRSRFKV